MSLTEDQIVHQNGGHFVIILDSGCYEVYANSGGTHSVRVAQIGYKGDKGLKKAIFEADRREGVCPQCKEKAPEIVRGLSMCFDCDERNFSAGVTRPDTMSD